MVSCRDVNEGINNWSPWFQTMFVSEVLVADDSKIIILKKR